jgi:hypothetical protein
LFAHVFAIASFVGLSSVIYDAGGGSGSWADLFAASWFVTVISAIAFARFTFLSLTIWAQLICRFTHP